PSFLAAVTVPRSAYSFPTRRSSDLSYVAHPNTADRCTASRLVQNERDAGTRSQLSDRFENRRRQRECQKANESSLPSLISIYSHERFLSAHSWSARCQSPSLALSTQHVR